MLPDLVSGAAKDPPPNVWLVGQESPAAQRKGRYSGASVKEHPAKTLPALARRMILEFTKPGETVLDPLSGIGTVGVEAVRLGRSYVGLEIEPRFVALQAENLEITRRAGATGGFCLLRGDARRLDPRFRPAEGPLLDGFGPFDAVVASPPLPRLVRNGRPGATAIPDRSALSRDDPGDLKTDGAFRSGMRSVCAGCFRLLRPGGLLVIAMRPGRDGERLRPFHHETARICEKAGFVLIDEIAAVLARVDVPQDGPARVVGHPSLGHRVAVRRLRERGFPISLSQVEFVLAFRKPFDLSQDKSGRQAALAGRAPSRERSGSQEARVRLHPTRPASGRRDSRHP